MNIHEHVFPIYYRSKTQRDSLLGDIEEQHKDSNYSCLKWHWLGICGQTYESWFSVNPGFLCQILATPRFIK